MTFVLPARVRPGPAAGGDRVHLGSHRDRLPTAPARTAAPARGVTPAGTDVRAGVGLDALDAVLVPAFRAVGRLPSAADAAAAARCPLVLLCSGGVTASAALAEVERRHPARHRPEGCTVVAIDVTGQHVARGDYPSLLTSRLPAAAAWRRHDAHLKRNLAILLARLGGWRRILFHNDDVTGLTADELDRTVALLDDPVRPRAASGWAYRDFPDNSVVCHAHREGGGEQDTFISDATLAVAVSGSIPFFPAVYNEDWLFLHPLLQRGEVVMAGDWLTQDRYDPFADLNRPVAEEFGDVLGEGLLRLEHLGEPVETAMDADFWEPELAHRARFIADVARRLPPGPSHDRARTCLRIALEQHQDDWARQLAGFVRAWREDLLRWEKHVTGLPEGLPLDRALAWLGVAPDALVSLPGRAADPAPSRR